MTSGSGDRKLAEEIDAAMLPFWRAQSILRLLSDVPDEHRAPLLDLVRRNSAEALVQLRVLVERLESYT